MCVDVLGRLVVTQWLCDGRELRLSFSFPRRPSADIRLAAQSIQEDLEADSLFLLRCFKLTNQVGSLVCG